jgi:hypothetical protein
VTDTDTTTVTAGELRAMLVDAARTAGDDPTLPMLRGVLLHTAPKGDGTVLVATSTDRFMLGQIHIPAQGSLAHEVFVDLDSVKRAVKLLALANPAGNVNLSIVDDTVTLRASDLSMAFETYAPTVGPGAQRVPDFPQFAKIFDSKLNTEERNVAIGPGLFATVAAIAKSRGEQIRFQVQGERRPVVFEIGEQYRGLVMPQRATAVDLVPLFIPPAETAAIEKAKADKAAAEEKAVEEKAAADLKAKRSAAAKKAAATRAAKRATPTTPARTTRKQAA